LKVQFQTQDEGGILSTVLSDWMMFDTPRSDIEKEWGGESLERSTKNDYRLFQKMMNVTANTEVLKLAAENLSTKHRTTLVELGDLLVKTLSSQILIMRSILALSDLLIT
jgi:hypothetical protein